ncbi:MAG: tyrosine-protein kinase Etk/Wzc, partial [Oceanospirillaceae bacterium]
MGKQKISSLNDEWDLSLLMLIARQSVVSIIVFFAFFAFTAFLYLRFTPPIYQSDATVQLGFDSRTTNILKTTNIYEQTIFQEIELLRSPVFLERSLEELPLQISYYAKGEILAQELYKTSPFKVEYKIKDPVIYGKPIYFHFHDDLSVNVEYQIGNYAYSNTFEITDSIVMDKMSMKLSIVDVESIFRQQNTEESQFYIEFNDPESIVSDYRARLLVNVLNEFAKTIHISIEEENAKKAQDIVNAIAIDFIDFDEIRKKESANSILEFVDDQLARIYDRLYETEDQLDNFRKQHRIETDPTHSRPLPDFYSRIDQLEEAKIELELDNEILETVKQELLSDKELDVYKLFSLLAGAEYEGVISDLLSKLKDLFVQKEKMLYVVTPTSDQIKTLEYQIEIQKNLLLESVNSVQNSLAKKKIETSAKLNNYVSKMSQQGVSYNEIEYSRLMRIYQVNESFYNKLVDKKAEYSISKAGYVSNNRILQNAKVATEPLFPNKRVVLSVCFIAALSFSIGLIGIRYLLHNKITTVGDIVKHTDAPVLGVIP